MTADPPEPFRIRDFDGSVDEYLRRCRWQLAAALDGHIEVDGRPILPHWDFDKEFWHVVTSGAWQSQRVLDLERCALMGQVWDTLERLAAGDPQVISWRENKRRPKPHGGTRRFLMVAPADFSLVVRLRDRPALLAFCTAYPLGADHAERMRARAAAA